MVKFQILHLDPYRTVPSRFFIFIFFLISLKKRYSRHKNRKVFRFVKELIMSYQRY